MLLWGAINSKVLVRLLLYIIYLKNIPLCRHTYESFIAFKKKQRMETSITFLKFKLTNVQYALALAKLQWKQY